ncbi:hypothetical protein BC826DRAFT_1019726 [Russula brevipes]|nr:hypothetical protein BC826DRAFT_1019726 [Russula brevipes]
MTANQPPHRHAHVRLIKSATVTDLRILHPPRPVLSACQPVPPFRRAAPPCQRTNNDNSRIDPPTTIHTVGHNCR